jgi:putative ABC transport system permease protein
LVAGRFYSQDFKGNDSEFVLNNAAVRAMQLDPDHALGKIITFRGQEGKIIGVIKDFNFAPLYQPIEPLVIRRRNSGDYLVIRTAAGSMQQSLTAAQDCFQKVYGNIPFSYGFIDQDLDHLYASESRMGLLFNIFSVLSIVISCLGLFGLATFATQSRTKEIGIRRVLGAGEAGIVMLLAKEFLRLVAISLLIAFPVAWYAMHQWLQGFAEKIDISGWTFAMAGGAALLVAFLTVSYQTIRAALMNPVKSLRTE